eukprot:2383698-Rhodomonas_salina.1
MLMQALASLCPSSLLVPSSCFLRPHCPPSLRFLSALIPDRCVFYYSHPPDSRCARRVGRRSRGSAPTASTGKRCTRSSTQRPSSSNRKLRFRSLHFRRAFCAFCGVWRAPVRSWRACPAWLFHVASRQCLLGILRFFVELSAPPMMVVT